MFSGAVYTTNVSITVCRDALSTDSCPISLLLMYCRCVPGTIFSLFVYLFYYNVYMFRQKSLHLFYFAFNFHLAKTSNFIRNSNAKDSSNWPTESCLVLKWRLCELKNLANVNTPLLKVEVWWFRSLGICSSCSKSSIM